MNNTQLHDDVFGLAYQSYFKGNKHAEIIVREPNFEADILPVSHFFRDASAMSSIELQALEHTYGHVLDVGAGAGAHSLELQLQGKHTTALDQSALACSIMQQRGVKQVLHSNFFSLSLQTFDTILMLMNGIGIIGSVDNLPDFFAHAATILSPQGQIIVDSSDLRFLYELEDGSYSLPLHSYYGDLCYTAEFNAYTSAPFPWTYIDFDTLSNAAYEHNWHCECIAQGEHHDFVVRLTQHNN